MGRKPNALVLEYFERGPKLNDNSNRYPHTCKLCGENFPKGRIDSLTTHIIQKCPAITESERARACLGLHNLASRRSAAERKQSSLPRKATSTGHTTSSQAWSALETLAEVSRQVDLNESSRTQHNQSISNATSREVSAANLDPQVPYKGEGSPTSYEAVPLIESAGEDQVARSDLVQRAQQDISTATELTPEERLQALLPVSDLSPDPSSISVAVAATARLNPSYLDPQLVNQDLSPSAALPMEAQSEDITSKTSTQPGPGETYNSQPWGEISYQSVVPHIPTFDSSPRAQIAMNRGGVRMDTSGLLENGRMRHYRSKFTQARRQEVREVRKVGACIRCRILRKLCSKGTPCDTCRKVLAPRVWMTGCVRTRLHEQLDLYSAGVQVVLSQNRINLHKGQLQLTDVGSILHASHFPDTGKHISLSTLVVVLDPDKSGEMEVERSEHQVIMINQDKEDVPVKIEAYMRDVLDLFIEREPSHFMRTTLELALQQLAEEEDSILRKAVELWGLVESIDRERQWSLTEKLQGDSGSSRPIKEVQNETDADIYTMICMQLNAAAERRATSVSRNLLNLMDRLLADSKTKAGFRVCLAALIFLNCIEKTTWAFRAWEQDHLRPGWPLERDPAVFTQQGSNLAGLLKMLLSIRKALPVTVRGEDGKLTTQEADSVVVEYFRSLDMDCRFTGLLGHRSRIFSIPTSPDLKNVG